MDEIATPGIRSHRVVLNAAFYSLQTQHVMHSTAYPGIGTKYRQKNNLDV